MEKDKEKNNLISSTSTALGELRDISIKKIMEKNGLEVRKRKHFASDKTSRYGGFKQ